RRRDHLVKLVRESLVIGLAVEQSIQKHAKASLLIIGAATIRDGGMGVLQGVFLWKVWCSVFRIEMKSHKMGLWTQQPLKNWSVIGFHTIPLLWRTMQTPLLMINMVRLVFG